MKDIKEYINEKLMISKDNIYNNDIYNEYLNILNVDVKSISQLRDILIDYLLSVYGDKDFNAGDINKIGPTQWDLGKNSRGFIETIGVSNQFLIDVNVNSDEGRGFSIKCGTVKEFPKEVVFKYYYNGEQYKPSYVIMAKKPFRFNLGENFLEWLLDIKEYVTPREKSCKEEIQLLKYFNIIKP